VHRSRSRSVLNRRGQALSEYAVLVAIVGMGMVVIIGLFGQATKQVWQQSESKFANDSPAASTAPSQAPGPAPSGGGGAASGSVQPTPPPSAPPPGKPKRDSSDSSSSAGGSPGGSHGGNTGSGRDPAADVP